MARRRAKSSPQAAPTSLTLLADPTAPFQVQLIKSTTPTTSLGPWWYGGVGLIIVLGGMLLLLWGSYVLPRSYPPPVTGASVMVTLVHPAYVAFGDDIDLEVTVTNQTTDEATGTVTVLSVGAVAVRPLPAETSTVKFEHLTGGASTTQRLKFSFAQNPGWWAQESVRLALQVAVGEQRLRAATEFPLAVAPLPYLQTLTSALFGSTLLAAIVAFFWDLLKKCALKMDG